jgi:hypothetical protein
MPKATAVFDADDSRVLAAAKRINNVLLGVESKFSKMAVFGAKLGAPILAAATAIGFGLSKAFDVGGHFSDLAANTGIGVEALAVLEQEFRNAGKSGEEVADVIGKMQKGLAAGTSSDAIRNLGLDLGELGTMTPVEQFYALGRAIDKLENPTDRAGAAMAIFGKSGASLLAMFSGSNFGLAAAEVGKQAAILGRDAALFDDVSDKLKIGGLKMQGFFIGAADKIAGVLQPLLDRLVSEDWAAVGQNMGEAIALPLQSFADGEFTNHLSQGISLAFGEAVNSLAGGLLALPALLGAGLMRAAAFFISRMMEGVQAILAALANVPGMGRSASIAAGAVSGVKENFDANAADGTDTGRVIADAMRAGKIFDTDMLRSQLVDSIAATLGRADDQREKALANTPQKTPGLGDSTMDAFSKNPAVSSLQRVGGAFGVGVGDPLLTETQRTNRLLGDIREVLKGRQPATAEAADAGVYGR